MDEFARWKAKYNMEPWGERREDLRSAQIVTAIRAAASDRQRLRVRDFMPTLPAIHHFLDYFDVPKLPPTQAELARRIELSILATGLVKQP